MSRIQRLFLPALLISGVFVVGAYGQSSEIRIEGNRLQEKVPLRRSQKAPKPAAGLVVVRAEFSESALETQSQNAGNSADIRVYAEEYFTPNDSRPFRSFMSGGARPSDIRYGSAAQRSDIRYGSGEPRSEIGYGSGEQRSDIRYGTGESRSEVQYGVTGGARNVTPYGGTAQR